jgi:exosortase E/protease (VPEID-CTERM system)
MNAEMTKRLVPPPTPRTHVFRGIGLLVLLCLEMLVITLRFDTQGLTGAAPWWAEWLGYAPAFLHMGLAGVAAFLVIVGPRLKTVWQAVCMPSSRHRWGVWLAWHLVTGGVFTLLTAAILDVETAVVRPSLLWPVAWTLSGATTLLLWCGAVAPPRRWWQLVQDEYAALLGASLVGVGVWGSSQITQAFWQPLAGMTFWVVRHLLGLLYADVHAYLPTKLVGTATFEVTIAPECSGYEGVGLVTLLLALYLWLFRAHLRFPQAIALLPVGALAAWVANALRITALIALGTSFSPAVALGGFHSQAGWIAFLLVGLGVIAVTQRYHLFAVVASAPASPAHAQYAAALLAPLLVMLATMVVTSALSSGVDWLYPLRVVTTGCTLWAFRKAYRSIAWTWSWPALTLGLAVFGVWMILEPSVSQAPTAFAEGLAQFPAGVAAGWLGFRVLGAVLTVPVVEELAFRGYVIHKLANRDFETIRPGQFTWWAGLLSSILFGMLHGRWLAGTLAGIGYALALRQRGQLADAIVAHMTTNALIATYVLSQQAWALWL